MQKRKEKMPEKLTNSFYFGRNARAAFSRREKQIGVIDKKLACAVSAFVLCVALFSAAVSFFLTEFAQKRWMFFIMSAISATAFLYYTLALKHGKRAPVAVHYLYYSAVLVAILLCGYFSNFDIKTTYCMLTVLFSMFIIDKPGRINLVFLAYTAAFLLYAHLSAGLSNEDVFALESMSGLTAFAAACFVSRHNVRTRLRDMAYKAHIEKERDTDGLTRLHTRAAAVRDISAFLLSNNQGDGECALFLIDIDNFKNVNDTLGHDNGDKLLVDISATLRSLLRRSDYVSRLGGDEFIIFLTDLPSHEWVNAKAAAINSALCKAVVTGKERVNVSASIGIAFADGKTSSYEALYRNADAAMYRAKQSGGNSFTVYSKALASQTRRQEHASVR